MNLFSSHSYRTAVCGLLLASISQTAPTQLVGDLNGDRVVDAHDLKILSDQWMQFPEGHVADITGDEKVDALDFIRLGEEWRLDQNIPTLRINEFVADNTSGSGMTDPQGDADDWIEIHNFGTEAIDLAGMHISDDPADPPKYQFPEGFSAQTTIPAGGYLVLWADNDVWDGPLHLPFKLSAGGEEIYLYKSDGYTLIDSVRFGDQKENLSLGRDPGSLIDPPEWAFLTSPTPGAANAPAYAGLVDSLSCNLEAGIISGTHEAILVCPTPGADIYYTLDGTPPVENGSPSASAQLYTAPLSISGTTTLRAAGFKDENRPGKILTRSYIYLNDIRNQSDATAIARGFPATWEKRYSGTPNADYGMDASILNQEPYNSEFQAAMLSIPTVSLVTDLTHFFDRNTGIYVNVYKYHDPDNPLENWERPTSVEIFDPLSGKQIQADCGVRLTGNQSRLPENPKHSLRLSFRDRYGPSKLDFPLFPGSSVNEHDSFYLRSQYHDSWLRGENNAQYLIDKFTQESQLAMGHLSPRSRMVHLYINGVYWGLYQACERPDNDFLASNEGGNEDDYELIEGVIAEPPFEWKGLGDETWTPLWDLVTAHSAENPMDAADFAELSSLLDMEQFIDYMILNTWICNWDWGPKNWYAGSRRPALPGEPPARKWHFYPWDSENSMSFHSQMQGIPFDPAGYTGGPKLIHNALHNHPQYRLKFADRIQVHCVDSGGAFSLSNSLSRYNALVSELYGPMLAESARWGDHYRDFLNSNAPIFTRGVHFDDRVDHFQNTFFNEKVDFVIGRYQELGLYPLTVPPSSFLDGQASLGGEVDSSSSITLSGDGSPIYYTLDGSDPALFIPAVYGGADIQLFTPTTARKYKVPTSNLGDNWKGGNEPYNESGWQTATGGIGYDRDDDFNTLISSDVESQMYGNQASCYIRVAFQVDSATLPNISLLKLRIQYDDGFVAFLNGERILSANAPDTLNWNSNATQIHQDAEALVMTQFDMENAAQHLQAGENILAIHALNQRTESSDFLIRFEFLAQQGNSSRWEISPTAQLYDGSIQLSQSALLNARALNNGEWSALISRPFVFGTPAADLRITELMYNPLVPDTEFIELQNTGSEDLDLGGIYFADGVSFTFSSQILTPGERVLLVENQTAFEALYGTGLPVAGVYSGGLSNSGETLTLLDPAGNLIHSLSYKDGWFNRSDGDGYSLTLRDPIPTLEESFSEAEAWKLSARYGGSPGAADENDVPLPDTIKINEVLAHSDLAPNDWIELINTGSASVNVGGWFLSDDKDNRQKYRIADGTIIPAGGYLLLTQDNHFGALSSDPGKLEAFALSENGDQVYLSAALDGSGQHKGYFEKEDFGASDSEVPMGRHFKASTGTYNFVALTAKTPGAANAAPVVGPVVISEIHYHPDWPTGSVYDNEEYEYLRITNISGASVTLYDAGVAEAWKIHGGVDFLFPSDSPVVLGAGASLYIVKNPAAFQSRYPGVSASQIAGPYSESLANDGESVNLSKPGDLDWLERKYIQVDRVSYSDGSSIGDLWPAAADGSGSSLQRISNSAYGNDPANWSAGTPSIP